MANKTKVLRKLMREHHLSAPQVAALLGRKPNTVRIWRVRGTARQIPDDALELLRLKLRAAAE